VAHPKNSTTKKIKKPPVLILLKKWGDKQIKKISKEKSTTRRETRL